MLDDLKGIIKAKSNSDPMKVKEVAVHLAKSARGTRKAEKGAAITLKSIDAATKALVGANKAGLKKREDSDWGKQMGKRPKKFDADIGKSLNQLRDAAKSYQDQAGIVARAMGDVAAILKLGAIELSVPMYTHSDAIDKRLPPAAKKLLWSAEALKVGLRGWHKTIIAIGKDQDELLSIIKESKSIIKRSTKKSLVTERVIMVKYVDLGDKVTQLMRNSNVAWSFAEIAFNDVDSW